MFPNLRAEMARQGINLRTLSEMTGIRYQTLTLKFGGKSELSLKECLTIKDSLKVDLPLEELFKMEER